LKSGCKQNSRPFGFVANGSSLTRAEIMEKFEGLLGRSFDGDALSFSIVGYAPAYFAALYTLKQHRAAVFIHRDCFQGCFPVNACY
jgi:hypothetical protein